MNEFTAKLNKSTFFFKTVSYSDMIFMRNVVCILSTKEELKSDKANFSLGQPKGLSSSTNQPTKKAN
jgi:hypothetical protein